MRAVWPVSGARRVVRLRPSTGFAVALALALALALAAACGGPTGGDDATGATTATHDPAGPAVPTDTMAPGVDPTGEVDHGALVVDGRQRSYRLYVPNSLPEGPVPLFVGLHGGTGWGDQFAATNHVEGLAEANGFLVVHPDGVGIGVGPGAVWNGGVCCGVAARDDVDDVAFVDTLLDDIEEKFDVDADRVFAFGHSNGGIMSYRLACELSERIVGIGVVAGTVGVESCDPATPVSAIHVHGTADEHLPLTGGRGEDSISGVDFPSPLAGFERLAENQDCPEPVETVDGDLTTALREPCAADTAMSFVTIEAGPHAWPGGTPLISRPRAEAAVDYDATAAVVSFLLAHPRP